MPNQWDDLIQGASVGLGAVMEGYNQMRDNTEASEIYRTAMKGIKKTLLDFQTQQEQQDQQKLGEINSMINQDPQTQQVATDLSVISTPANVKGGSTSIEIKQKPISMADLYQQVSDASVRLSQLGERGKLKADQLAGYLDVALKDKDTKLVKVGTDYYTYKSGDVLGSLQKLYSPDTVKASKMNIVWGEPEYIEENGKYYRSYPIEDTGTGQLLEQRHKQEITPEEYQKWQRSLLPLERKPTGRGGRRSYGSPKKENFNYGDDMMMGETKAMANILRQVQAMGGLDKVEDLADQMDANAIALLKKYDAQSSTLASYGVDPISAVTAFENSKDQAGFMDEVDTRQSYIEDINAVTRGMFSPANFENYRNSPPASNPQFANKWDEELWLWVDQLEADGVPNDIIDRYIKRPYDKWRKQEWSVEP